MRVEPLEQRRQDPLLNDRNDWDDDGAFIGGAKGSIDPDAGSPLVLPLPIGLDPQGSGVSVTRNGLEGSAVPDAAVPLWIVMPAYNEVACLEQVVVSWLRAVDALGIVDTTLLIVDDGSTDATPQLADDLARRDGRVRVLHQANAGHGAAVLGGYRRALAGGAQWVFQTDSDEQMTPVDLASLWAGRHPDGLIVGYRAERQDPTSRKLISASLRLGLRLLFGVSVRDANVPYRLFAGPYLAALLDLLPASLATPNVALSVLAARDRRLVEIPAHHGPRRTGRSTLVSASLLRLCARSFSELLQVRRIARGGRTAAATPSGPG